MNETNIAGFKRNALALALASSLVFPTLNAEAAGMGRLTVLSALGQPLRAEVEVNATKEEAAGMTARLAPQDAFKQSGIDYASVLHTLRFAVERRDSGQVVLKVTSSKPISEPFLDFLVELNWPGGRLVREYTFLLDPPEISDRGASRSSVDAKVVETVRGKAAIEARALPAQPMASSVTATPAPKVKARSEERAAASGEQHVVRRGETLAKIAADNRPEGVSLEQMLVGIFRNNPDAFVGQNLNRLKEGAILTLPSQEEAASLSKGEARKIYLAQTGDWKAYRQKLAAATAAAPAKDQPEATQLAAGKVNAKVDDKALPTEKGKDQVKVGRSEAAGKGADATKGSGAEEDRVARDKAYREAQERLALLEKNVSDLQKLLEVKNQKLAELQQGASQRKDESKPAPVPAAEIKKAPEPASVSAAKPAVEEKPAAALPAEPPKSVEPPKSAEPAKPVESAKPAAETQSVSTAAPVQPQAPKPKPKPVMPPPPPPEPDLIDSLLADPLPLVAGGGLLALLGGGFFFWRRRGIKASPALATTTPMPSSLGPNSVFRMTGGQSVDTANVPLHTGEFSQTGPGMIDTDEVDPVAEADVYIAYGRDTQAEEILLEALNKDPRRTAIHAKLLEIYAARGSLKQFETLASELYAQTDGQGQDWARVAAMGVKLDPANPLYFGAGQPAASDQFSVPVLPAEPEASADSPIVPDFSVSDSQIQGGFATETSPHSPFATSEVPAPEVAQEPVAGDSMALDFDIGGAAPASAPAPVMDEPIDVPAPVTDVPVADFALDFDLGAPAEASPQASAATLDFDLNPVADKKDESLEFSSEGTLIMPSSQLESMAEVAPLELAAPPLEVAEVTAPVADGAADMSLDFDFDMSPQPAEPASEGLETIVASPSAMVGAEHAELDLGPSDIGTDSLDFDVDLGKSVFMVQSVSGAGFDMGSINLDLGEPLSAPEAAAAPLAEDDSAVRDEANTKLDLAKAYEEIGDLDGARELLNEIAAEAPADLVAKAKEVLARIGA